MGGGCYYFTIINSVKYVTIIQTIQKGSKLNNLTSKSEWKTLVSRFLDGDKGQGDVELELR